MQILFMGRTVKSFTFSSTTLFFMERSMRLSKSVEATEIGYKYILLKNDCGLAIIVE